MRVPIQTDEDQEQKTSDKDTQATNNNEQQAVADQMTEEEMIEAAKRAGESAAEEEIAAAEAKKLADIAAERDALQQELDGVQEQISTAEKTAQDATEKLARLQADWDNYRKRTAQQRNEERDRAAEKLISNLLPILDDMERALEHSGQTETSEADSPQFSQFVSGVEAVHDKMLSILEKEGVRVINPLGEPFDPLIHQAVGRVEDAESFDETVAAVYQRGYYLGNKVIREAMVQVTFGGPKRPAPEAECETKKSSE